MIKACFGGEEKTTHCHGATLKSASIVKIRSRTKGSHLAVERQLFCYRLIRKLADRNGNVGCRLCSKGIKATDGISVWCRNIIAHAYRHLTTPLYRCRICSVAYYCHRQIDNHLQAVHALPCLERNYECLADQYHSDVMTIISKCYSDDTDSTEDVAFRNLCEPNICRKSKRSKLTLQRNLSFHRRVQKCADADRLVQCRLCSKQISAKDRNGFTSVRVMQHASLHLGKSLYQCKKCTESYVTPYGMTEHLREKHALPFNETYFQCLADQLHDELVKIFRQCYGDEGNKEDGLANEPTESINAESGDSMSLVPSKLTIERQTLCKQLIRECSDQAHKKLKCRLCNKHISVKRISGIGSDAAMLHAVVHVEKPMYRCKICSEMFVSRTNVGQHVRTKHAVPVTNNYDCLGDQYHAEIIATLRKCFNNEVVAEAKPFKSRARAESAIRSGVKGSKQAAERQLLCYRVINKFVNSDGKVECRLCKKRIVAKKTGGKYQSSCVMMHAMIHLNKPIYRCMACSEKRTSLNAIVQHLKKAHAIPSADNYESVADKYHLEILAMLSQCYGEL